MIHANPAYIVLVVVGVSMCIVELVVRRRRRMAVDLREAWVSVRVGTLGYGAGSLTQALLMTVGYWATSSLVPWKLPLGDPLTWLGYIVLDDFSGYWWHRSLHRFRFLWSAHLVHHSSEDFTMANSTRISPAEALYQPLANMWAPFLGFPIGVYAPITVASLLLAELQHTRIVGKLRWADPWLNTPSNHRVHHGRQPQYHDCNFGGWTMIWDRMFGTYVPETEPVVFGVTDPLDLTRAVPVALGGYPKLVRDMRAAPSPGAALALAARRPGATAPPRSSTTSTIHAQGRRLHDQLDDPRPWELRASPFRRDPTHGEPGDETGDETRPSRSRPGGVGG